MKVITGTIPKTTFLGATICGKGRTYLAVGHDSAGTIDYFSRLYLMLGIEMTATSRDHFITAEEARRNDKEYKKNLDVTKKRATKKSEASRSQYNKAQELYESCLERRRDILGDDHPDTLNNNEQSRHYVPKARQIFTSPGSL
jgi:hypothetical protein